MCPGRWGSGMVHMAILLATRVQEGGVKATLCWVSGTKWPLASVSPPCLSPYVGESISPSSCSSPILPEPSRETVTPGFQAACLAPDGHRETGTLENSSSASKASYLPDKTRLGSVTKTCFILVDSTSVLERLGTPWAT